MLHPSQGNAKRESPCDGKEQQSVQYTNKSMNAAWTLEFLRADWLVRKWIISTNDLQATDETKSRVVSSISDHFLPFFFCNCEVDTNYPPSTELFRR